ncbi:unnamed protein product [Rhizophagus irregularis]|nr:unnamed protein product [Rhizophagus irregularis]
MSQEFFQEVVNDLEKLLTTEKGYDVIIYAGENENIKELHAHSNILCTRSQYFNTAFSHEWAEKKDGKFIFKKPNVSPQLFKIILRFIYCGKIDLKELQGPEVKPNIVEIQPPRISKHICDYDSILIKNHHFAVFASWIDKKNNLLHYNMKNIPYNFDLLYRVSRDSNTPATYHAKCDNKGPTIVVVKISNSEKIVGGYNPLIWISTNQVKSTNDSFIYLFTDRIDTKSAKVSYSNGDNYSIRNLAPYGPGFGQGSDLICRNDGQCYSFPSNSYPKIDGIPGGIFPIDDYEVFEVIKK